MTNKDIILIWRYESSKFIFKSYWEKRKDSLVRKFLKGQLCTLKELKKRLDNNMDEIDNSLNNLKENYIEEM